MTFTEYLIPTLTLITAGYVSIAFYFYKKSQLHKAQIEKVEEANKIVKKSVAETNEKVAGISHSVEDKLVPTLKNIELEIKNINCHLSAEMVLEKLVSNGYKKAKLINDSTIVTGVSLGREDKPEGFEFKVGHIISVELKNSAILIESYSLTIQEPTIEVYEAILKENANLKVSDYGIETINGCTFVIAQSYVIYPKESFHITPLIEALDHLELAQLSLEEKLTSLGSRFKNISIQDYAEARLEHAKEKLEESS
ncbi:hypothetical protein [Shewanella algae]|uniref:hypothetical protein n=1 Tax=Shewanella algae TaxID=38313 RepID=UPI001AAEC93A|nr:hypothetical protein [Shewanella algae]MBO2621148.1 hypothetical protein [Shewanella algae]